MVAKRSLANHDYSQLFKKSIIVVCLIYLDIYLDSRKRIQIIQVVQHRNYFDDLFVINRNNCLNKKIINNLIVQLYVK